MFEDRQPFSCCAFALPLLLVLSGCGSDRTQRVTFTVAAEAGGADCDLTAAIAEPCTTVQVFLSETGEQLELVEVDDTGDTKMGFKLRFQSLPPMFDVTLDEADVASGARIDVHVVVHDSTGAARFGAWVERVDPRDPAAEIRLYPFGQWSCPGTGATPRALHGAQRVGDDEVLIFGGVAGDEIDPLSLRDPAEYGGPLAVGGIEVYDGRTHEFRPVTIINRINDQDPALRRVLFATVDVGPEVDPDDSANTLHRIRLLGGYQAEGGVAMVHFDSLGTRGPAGAPIVPSRFVEAAGPVDLVYNARAGTVTIEDAAFSGAVARGGPLAVGDFFGMSSPTDPALVAITLAPMGGGFAPPTNVYSYTREGDAVDAMRVLETPRLGPAVLTVADGFLVWGGAINPDVRATAGELFPPRGGDPMTLAAPPSVPVPAAFHSWNRTGEDRFLIAGGFAIQGAGEVGEGTLLEQLPDTPIYYLEVGRGGVLAARVVPADGYVSTIFHTATMIPEVGVVLIGGARPRDIDETAANDPRLVPQDQAALVAGAALAPFPNLGTARWGHTATLLSGHRLLVVGGFSSHSMALDQLTAATPPELYYWDAAPRALLPGECGTHETMRIDAAVEHSDGGLPPITPPPSDAGAGSPDGGPGAMDAAAPVDAGF